MGNLLCCGSRDDRTPDNDRGRKGQRTTLSPDRGERSVTPNRYGQAVYEDTGERYFGDKYEAYRQEAHEAGDKMALYAEQSQQAWQRGDKGKASDYSKELKAARARMEKANCLAAIEVIRPQLQPRATIGNMPEKDESKGDYKPLVQMLQNSTWRYPKLDLHGLYVREAEEVLEAFLDTFSKNKTEKQVCVVFGQGNHSENHRAKIGPAVKGFLRRANLKFADDVTASGNHQNRGAVIVYL
ncbi:unnamed protein product [Amoebophrya sp. A25]|nr:unnamed protein product [Amoebophrya sp. A25]|eukprot:GSA25T00001573001.1